MATIKTLKSSFNGGELSPEMFGQIGDAKYQTGAAKLRNFVAKPQGPIENRAGFAFVREVKDSTKKTTLVPFTYSTTQTMQIEMGAGYFRFHTQGATLLYSTPSAWATATAYVVGDLRANGGVNYYCRTAHTSGTFATDLASNYWYALPSNPNIYEIPNSYAEADLFDIKYEQSADVLTFVHPNYAPQEIRRLGATNWQLTTIQFTPSISAPSSPTATPTVTGSSGAVNMYYVVTSIAADGVSESSPSTPASCLNNIFSTGAYNTISWASVAGATRYNVYKLQGGLYGYIGQTTGLSIVDDNISPDLSKTPPIYDTVFNNASNYPGAVSYFEQRRCFAGTINNPQTIWMTRSATETDMSYSLPLRDDDRIKFRIAAREANTIRHIVPLSQLILLTSSAEWRVTSINSDAVTQTTFSVKPQSYVGASNVRPTIVNNTLLYCAARGGHIRELGYNWQAQGFVTGDLSIRSAHLFDTYDITTMAYEKAPIPIVWMTSTSGKLLGLTYVPEQGIGAWHQHDTDGVFEACSVVAEGMEDVLYVVVRRTINGTSKRYIERMASRQFVDPADAFFVDAGSTYNGAPTSTISGLDYLEGKTVNILADGAVHPQRVVTSGSITLDVTASKVQVGLPIQADLQTLPLAMQIDSAFGQGRYKNINRAWLRVYRSSGIFAGPSETELTEVKQRTIEPYGSPPALKSEEVEVMTQGAWTDSAQLYVRQSDPLPLTIASLTLEVALGG